MRKMILALSSGCAVFAAWLWMSCAVPMAEWKAIQQSEQHELIGTWSDWGQTSTGISLDIAWVFSTDYRFKIVNQDRAEILHSGQWQTHGDTLTLAYDLLVRQDYTRGGSVSSFVYSLIKEELALTSIDDPHVRHALRMKR